MIVEAKQHKFLKIPYRENLQIQTDIYIHRPWVINVHYLFLISSVGCFSD